MTNNTKHTAPILPSYCYPAGTWHGKVAEQPWTKSDSAVLIGGLVAVVGFCAFIVVFTAGF